MKLNLLKTNAIALLAVSSLFSFTVNAQENTNEPENKSAACDEKKHQKGFFNKHHSNKHKHHKMIFKTVDTNGDGQIDINEFLTNAEQRFQNMDLNSNGYVTQEEGREAHKSMRKKFREDRKKERTEKE